MTQFMTVKKSLVIALCAIGLSSVTACNRSPDTEAKKMESSRMEVDSGDTKFFTEAAQGGMLEVKLAQLATTQATNPQVKQFAETMMSDHQENNKMLLALATEKSVSLPPSFDGKAQKTIDDLKEKSGPDFDKAYTKEMVDAHQDMADLLGDVSKNSKDPEIRNFAQQTLPKIQHHLEMAKAMESTAGAMDSSSSSMPPPGNNSQTSTGQSNTGQ